MKKETAKIFQFLIIGAFLVGGLMVAGPYLNGGPTGQQTLPGSGSQPSTTVSTQVQCLSTTAPSVNLLDSNLYTGAALSASDIRWRIANSGASVGGPWTVIRGGTAAFAPNVGNNVELAYGAENTTYYGIYKPSEVVKCETVPSITTQRAQVATPTSISVSIALKDGSVQSISNNQSIAAGDSLNQKITLTGQYQRNFGATDNLCGANPNVLTIRYNTSEFQSITPSRLDSSTGQYVALTTANVPVHLTAIAGLTMKSYAFPVITSNAELKVNLAELASATNNPGAGGSGVLDNTNNVTVFLSDGQLYLDSTTTNNIFCGIEDETNTATGGNDLIANLNIL